MTSHNSAFRRVRGPDLQSTRLSFSSELLKHEEYSIVWYRRPRGESHAGPGISPSCSYANMSLSVACSKLKVLLRNLNNGSLSTPEALLSIPGLGRTRVARLLDLQKAADLRGKPIGVGDLLGVPGISSNLLAKIIEDPTAVFLLKFAMYYRDVTDASVLVSSPAMYVFMQDF